MAKTPIWTVAEPGTRRPRFSREQIARTALTVADADGFEALSMRRIAEELGAGTMTLYYYVRTKEDLLTLVEDALLAEICDACDPIPKAWRTALKKLASATRDTYVRHGWALQARTGVRAGPNSLRHIEQSLQALAALDLEVASKLDVLSIVDDYVLGHCVSVARRLTEPQLDRKMTKALSDAMRRHLGEGAYPQLRALFGSDPVDGFVKSAGFLTADRHFELGLDALLDGLAKRFKLR